MTPPPVSVITPESDVVPPWAKTEIDERHTASASSASRCTERCIELILLPPGAVPRCLAHNCRLRPRWRQTAGRLLRWDGHTVGLPAHCTSRPLTSFVLSIEE